MNGRTMVLWIAVAGHVIFVIAVFLLAAFATRAFASVIQGLPVPTLTEIVLHPFVTTAGSSMVFLVVIALLRSRRASQDTVVAGLAGFLVLELFCMAIIAWASLLPFTLMVVR